MKYFHLYHNLIHQINTKFDYLNIQFYYHLKKMINLKY